eukprot:6481986-Amphidinium_carterae.3
MGPTRWHPWICDLSALSNQLLALERGKGKGRSKGKRGKGSKDKDYSKGKGKDGGKCKEKGKQNPPKFEGDCGLCDTWGHKARDCRGRIAPLEDAAEGEVQK